MTRSFTASRLNPLLRANSDTLMPLSRNHWRASQVSEGERYGKGCDVL